MPPEAVSVQPLYALPCVPPGQLAVINVNDPPDGVGVGVGLGVGVGEGVGAGVGVGVGVGVGAGVGVGVVPPPPQATKLSASNPFATARYAIARSTGNSLMRPPDMMLMHRYGIHHVAQLTRHGLRLERTRKLSGLQIEMAIKISAGKHSPKRRIFKVNITDAGWQLNSTMQRCI